MTSSSGQGSGACRANAASSDLDTAFVHRLEAPAQDLVEQRGLAAEVVIHGPEVHVGQAGDLPEGGAVESPLGEADLRRVEDSLAGRSHRALPERSGAGRIIHTIE